MRTLKVKDITPVSEFRANAAELLERVRTSQRPLVLTQRGRASAVVLDADVYGQLVEEIETLRDIHTAEKELEAGDFVSHREAKAELRRRFRE